MGDGSSVVTDCLAVTEPVGQTRYVKDEPHPTVAAFLRAEKRYRASAERLATDKAAFEAARAARDQAIEDDPDPVHASVARRFKVSATWVKKVRGVTGKKDATE